MEDFSTEKQKVAQAVQAMYNQHPFPNQHGTLERRSDERYCTIYKEFLNLPFDELAGKIFLDAGCGTGENTWYWRRNLPANAQVLAIDLSQASVRIARQRGQGEPLQPAFAVGSLMDFGLASNSVDAVFCSGVLGNSADAERGYPRSWCAS